MKIKVELLEKKVAMLSSRPSRDFIGEAVSQMSSKELHNLYERAIQAKFSEDDRENNERILHKRLQEISQIPNGINLEEVKKFLELVVLMKVMDRKKDV